MYKKKWVAKSEGMHYTMYTDHMHIVHGAAASRLVVCNLRELGREIGYLSCKKGVFRLIGK